MKPKLPCCEINKKSQKSETNLECEHCECVFAEKEQLDDHNREIHKVPSTGKRKLVCCERNLKRKKPNEFHHHSCNHCECTFRKKRELHSHMYIVHECPVCHQIVLTKEIRAQHKTKHEEEKKCEEEKKREKEEMKKLQQQKDDDLVDNFVKTNQLDEYQRDPDYEPDIDYIVYKKNLSKEELLRFVKKFEVDCILDNHLYNEDITCEQITFLLENDALSYEDVANFLDGFTLSLGRDEIVPELVSYFLDKGYEIKKEWVAKAIDDDALMERIKQKYAYTFDEIYYARDQCSLFGEDGRKRFYVQVHKHFPDPEFEDPFADPYIDFKCVSTEHVCDYLQNRYFYDEEEDELSIVIRSEPEEREISLGSCKEMLKMDLQDLIDQYNGAIESYKKPNARVSDLFDKRDKELHDRLTEKQRLDVLDYFDYELYRDALPERNFIANEVSKLYFVIAKK